MRHAWSDAPTNTERRSGVQRCMRRGCKLKRRRVRDVCFETGRLRWFPEYRWPTGSWFFSVGQPACIGGAR